jgi:hypothetical protein
MTKAQLKSILVAQGLEEAQITAIIAAVPASTPRGDNVASRNLPEVGSRISKTDLFEAEGIGGPYARLRYQWKANYGIVVVEDGKDLVRVEPTAEDIAVYEKHHESQKAYHKARYEAKKVS